HMTHDATVSLKGRQLLISLMLKDTTKEFIRIAVPTLARLAVKSHIEISETVTFLLNFLQREPRQSCRKLILHYLVPIARQGSIVWLNSTTSDIIKFANDCDDDYVRLQVFKIILALTERCGDITVGSSTDLKQLLQMFVIHDNINIAYSCCLTTLRLLTKYLRKTSDSSARNEEQETNDTSQIIGRRELNTQRSTDTSTSFSAKVFEDLLDHLQSALMFLLMEVIQTNHLKELQDTLKLIEELCRHHSPSAQSFICLLITVSANVDENMLQHITSSLLHLSTYHPQLIKNEMDHIRQLLLSATTEDIRYNLISLLVLSYSLESTNEIIEYSKLLSNWKCFLLARWCVRHCLYSPAIELFRSLADLTESPSHKCWLETITNICHGEACLQIEFISNDIIKCDLQLLCENLSKANSFYESSLIQMPSMTPYDDILSSPRAENTSNDDINSTFDFERSYCDIRSSIIQQFYELIHTLNNSDIGLISLDLMGKRMLSIISKRLNTISLKINDIVQSCFDGDSQTLWCLSFNRFICDIVVTVIEKIIRNVRLEKNEWQRRLNELSWRDGFNERIFVRFQHVIEFVCIRLNSDNNKKTKKIEITEFVNNITKTHG
ncbi:unnamed protein product, partial [Didymodactylos carnosus]